MPTKISQKYLNKRFWRNKVVLITGINGFIGGNLAKLLINLGSKVIGITNKKNKNKFLYFEKIDSSLNIHQADITNFKQLNKIINRYNIDICFHLAAQVDVNVAKTNPFETFETNIRGTYNLLEILRKHKNIRSIIIASSDKAYGEYELKKLPYLESYDLRQLYPYDVSKASADMISKSYASSLFNLPVIVTRFSNIYGPGQLNFTALIPDCILANLGYRKFIPRGNGKNKRDFLYVDDVCDLYLCLAFNLTKNKNLKGEVYNAGTGKGYEVRNIIENICSLNNNKNLYKEISKNLSSKKLTGEIEHQFMNYKKIYKSFKWKPRHNLAKGLIKTIDWYKKFLNRYNYKDFLNR